MTDYTPVQYELVWDNPNYEPVSVDTLQAALSTCDPSSLVGFDAGGNYASIIQNIYTIKDVVVIEPLLLYTDQCAWAKECSRLWTNEVRKVLTVDELQGLLSLYPYNNQVSTNPNDSNGRPMGIYQRPGFTFIKVVR